MCRRLAGLVVPGEQQEEARGKGPEAAKQLTVDATSVGNVARWINHSCDPNIQCGSEPPPGWPSPSAACRVMASQQRGWCRSCINCAAPKILAATRKVTLRACTGGIWGPPVVLLVALSDCPRLSRSLVRSVLCSARLPVMLVGSPLDFADYISGSLMA